ncbi:MAG: MOSC domain-containing protein, partial [Sphingomonadaceae bacterium]|nr:MOSC domain-containing protein [Sphingomonadaceae bacterium]
SDVCIGDRFRLGSALLEISQPRKPCWKIEHHFARKGMVARIIKQHNCGWYYRVVEEGGAQAGDSLERVEVGHEGWSVARVFAALYDPAHEPAPAQLRELVALEKLSGPLRDKLAARLET